MQADPTVFDSQFKRSRRPRLWRRRCGFTLLEVILAIAILAISVASLGEVISLAGQNSREARDLTRAQLIAASQLAEITSGAIALEAVTDTTVQTVDTNPPWLYSVELTPTPDPLLVAVRVTVKQDLPAAQSPVTFSLVRWMPDPMATTTSSSTTSSGSTTGT